ncbi:MAG: 50S ribosomal protein L11 methyltransferase [Ruminococcus sp.]|nr:50S ribosomal protein L11 methyltransferase [Ruminococcus sp.]
MNWIQTEIFTATDGIDELCAYLLDIGIKGFVIKDSNDFQEFLDNKSGNWDYIDEDLMNLSNCETSITVYIPDDTQGAEMIISLKSLLKNLKANDVQGRFGRLELEFSNVKEEDWANNWKQYFKPLKVGNKLLIKPSWEEYNNTDNRTILEIDPASSFGTGQHNTTKLCLEFLENCLNVRDKVLDLGCGSGILSIGAMLLGADSVTAVDIEDHSVKTAIENAQKNGISTDKYTAYCGNIIDDEELSNRLGTGYDIITANIVADVLIAMKDYFYKYLKDDGILIISGIIDSRKNQVINEVVSANFKVVDIKELDNWVSVKLIKC